MSGSGAGAEVVADISVSKGLPSRLVQVMKGWLVGNLKFQVIGLKTL